MVVAVMDRRFVHGSAPPPPPPPGFYGGVLFIMS